MKDAYSFHIDDVEFSEYYEGIKKVYLKIFERLELLSDTYVTLADG
jgi:prolyl-tRNA synthetase